MSCFYGMLLFFYSLSMLVWRRPSLLYLLGNLEIIIVLRGFRFIWKISSQQMRFVLSDSSARYRNTLLRSESGLPLFFSFLKSLTFPCAGYLPNSMKWKTAPNEYTSAYIATCLPCDRKGCNACALAQKSPASRSSFYVVPRPRSSSQTRRSRQSWRLRYAAGCFRP